jgi:hypothetical protein
MFKKEYSEDNMNSMTGFVEDIKNKDVTLLEDE